MTGAAQYSDVSASDEPIRLPAWRVRLSELKLFNVLSNKRWRMPRRALSRLCFGVRQGVYTFDISVLSGSGRVERNALTLDVEFYSLSGRRLKARSGGYVSRFPVWSDIVEANSLQRIYVDVPEGAFAAHVSLYRTHTQNRADVASSFTLKRFKAENIPDVDSALSARDEGHLRYHLEMAQAKSDRDAAQKILGRLVYLFDQEADRGLLETLKILDFICSKAPQMSVNANEAEAFPYEKTFSPVPIDMRGFLAWVECESAQLRSQGTPYVELVGSEDQLERLLAVRLAGLYVITEQTNMIGETAIASWIDQAYIDHLMGVS